MWKSESKTSFRIKGLPSTLTKDDIDKSIKELVQNDCEVSRFIIDKFGKRSFWKTRTSAALQGKFLLTTVSCPSKYHKRRLMKLASRQEEWKKTDIGDSFSGITVLHSPPQANVDICIVHGLNGNAIDTFGKKHVSFKEEPIFMWLRDILPEDDDFEHARTMTYDYNSKLFDRKDESTLIDWATDLLKEIDQLRDTEMKSIRPVVFIGYSFGGIVIREAAKEMHYHPQIYATLDLRKCGFIFLGTPHRGSTVADYGPIKLAYAEHFGIRSSQLVSKLRSYNGELKESRKAWNDFYKKGSPPIQCFCEARKTPVLGGRLKLIVTPESANWMDVDATPIRDSDHHTICAFANRHEDGYVKIAGGICAIIKALATEQFPDVQQIFPSRSESMQVPTIPFSARKTWPVSKSGPISGSLPEFETRFMLNVEPQFNSIFLDLLCRVLEDRKWYFPYENPKLWYDKGAFVPRLFSGISEGTAYTPSTLATLTEVSSDDQSMDKGSPQAPGVESKVDEMKSSESKLIEAKSTSVLSSSEAAWNRNSLLSIDGGGVRGYVSLLFLKALMKKIAIVEREESSQPQLAEEEQRSEDPVVHLARTNTPISVKTRLQKRLSGWSRDSRQSTTLSSDSEQSRSDQKADKISSGKEEYFPCHYFDYIIGTGTGGLIAIMLSRLRMSIDQSLREYVKISRIVFGRQRQRLLHLYALPKVRYGSRHLTDCVQELVKRYGGSHQSGNGASFASEEDLCKTVVIGIQSYKEINVPKLFRSYDLAPPKAASDVNGLQRTNLRNPGPADSCRIWEAARATSAAPSYFKPITIDGTTYVDGGFSFNNPSREIINEVLRVHNDANNSINCLVSIGTGRPKKSKDDFFKPGRLNWVRNSSTMLKAAYESDSTHEDTESFMMARELPYFRFNVEADTWKLPLTTGTTEEERAIRRSWKDDVIMELDKKHVKDYIKRCARMLVQQRRERAQNAERWRRFSLVTSYACPHEKFQFKRSRELRSHLEFDHKSFWRSKSEKEKAEYISKCEIIPPVTAEPLASSDLPKVESTAGVDSPS